MTKTEYYRLYFHKNKERILRARKIRYYLRGGREKRLEHYQANKEKVLKISKAWKERNKDKLRGYWRRDRANPEKYEREKLLMRKRYDPKKRSFYYFTKKYPAEIVATAFLLNELIVKLNGRGKGLWKKA